MMILHIFKKDLKLLWPLAAIVALAEAMNAIFQFMLGHFQEPADLAIPAEALPIAIILGIAALVAAVVQEDALPGDRQDWLVRPIHRRDLVLAKLLFVLVAVHGPMLAVDLARGMATGFGFGASLSAGLSHGIFMLLSYSMPIMALAAMTSTLVGVAGRALVILLAVIVVGFVSTTPLPLNFPQGMEWMLFGFLSAVALATAVAVISLQYFYRASRISRAIALSAFLMIPIFACIPWSQAYSFQKFLATDSAAAAPIAVGFDPNVGKYVPEPGIQTRTNSAWLPLRVTGLPPESILIDDRTDVRITAHDGTILFRGIVTADGQISRDRFVLGSHEFPVRTVAAGDVRTHESLALPKNVFELMRSQSVRIELDYSLTLLRMEASDAIPALNGNKRIANFGWCKTKVDEDDDGIKIGCIGTESPFYCVTFALENTVSGLRNPVFDHCEPSYAPYTPNFSANALEVAQGELHFRDPQGLAKYPVNSSQLSSAQVVLKSYKVASHFTRHVVIPEIRLSDWEIKASAVASGTAPPK